MSYPSQINVCRPSDFWPKDVKPNNVSGQLRGSRTRRSHTAYPLHLPHRPGFRAINTTFFVADKHITLWYYSLCDKIKLASWQTQISSFNYAPLGAKTILSCSHFEDDSSPHISGSGSPIRIKIQLVLFNHASLMWINYLETRSHWDNTSCYYK